MVALPRSILCKLQLGPPRRPDFKFELLPLHSPLLRQSLLVSFPPLIDMLKFSGYSYLIRGQRTITGGFYGRRAPRFQNESVLLRSVPGAPAAVFEGLRAQGPNARQSLRVVMTLEQACPPECWRAQCAFKDSMIH